ncbi:unnamed protein product [Rotaria sp. Silwood1]|nr:unnamed protein product [Rotaria sp. Silwood1]
MYMELTNKGLSKRQRILEIMQTSQMRFIEQRKTQYGNDKHQFDIKIMIKEQTLSTVEQTSIMVREKVVERPITYIDLHELRDRARLIEYSSSEEKKLSEEERNRLQSFVKMVELIETILKNLTSLNLSGHPFVSEYLKPERRFRCDAGNFNELENMSEELQQLQTEWNDYLLKKYQDYISLTYFSHQQIWLVEEYLYGEETESKNPFSYHFMKLIGINISLIDTKLLPKKANKPEERLENIGRILNTAHILTMIESSSKSDTNKIVFLVGTSDEGILRAILSIFQLYKMPPKYNHLFYCTSATSWIEIRAFVYRCFYSKNSLHQLIRPEQLSLSVQDQFTNLIREVIKNNPEHSFRLAVITTAPTDQLQLINSLKILQIVQTVSNHELLNEEKLKNEVEKLIGNNCYLVTSSISGLGKSIYIQDEIQCMNKEYIKFPISGNFDIDTIAERLLQKTTQLLSLQAAIHLDIGIIDNIQEFNEFLYCLLIFRAFRSRHTAITIPVDLPIFIEFDSSPSSIRMTSKVVVLQYLSRQHFDRINWNQLKIENRLNTLYVVKCLAELSPHNPLKVLHSELEVDTCRHGFVGLSNWRLDASKMNRALYLACPDPDENDLQSTASAILQAEILRNNQVARPDDKIIQGLVATYHSLYELMNNDRKYESYFGLRDYYAMMKSIVHDLVVPQHGKDLYESIRRHLKANFDGTWDASEYMWETFCEHIGQHNFIGRYKSVSKFDQILDQCLSTRTGRY